MTLSEIIRSYRTRHHMTMEQLAKRTGLSKPYISMLENNRNSATGKTIEPSLTTLERLARGMGLPLTVLLETMSGDGNFHPGDSTGRTDMRVQIEAISRSLASGEISWSGRHRLTPEELDVLKETVAYMEQLLDVMEGRSMG